MEQPDPRSTSILSLAVVCEGGLALLAFLLGWPLGISPASSIHCSAAAVGLGCAASLPLLGMLLLVTHVPFGPLGRLNRLVAELIVPIFAGCRWTDFAVISLLAGFGEELLFRGLLQAGVSRSISPTAGLLAASLAFGLAHPISISYAVLVTLFGLYLGGVWLATDNLLVAIVAHAVYDFLALVYLMRRKPREPQLVAPGA
jgi:uncharacterized protein